MLWIERRRHDDLFRAAQILAGRRRMRLRKRRCRQQRANQRPLHNRFSLGSRRERTMELELRGIERRHHVVVLGTCPIRLPGPHKRRAAAL